MILTNIKQRYEHTHIDTYTYIKYINMFSMCETNLSIKMNVKRVGVIRLI